MRVIISSATQDYGTVEASIIDLGGTDVRQFENFPLRVATMSARAALSLASRNEISHISLDREVRILGHLSHTTGADTVRAQQGPSGNRLDGTGIGIAVLDSGIDNQHRSFLDRTGNLRVVMSQDFTGEGRTDDPYGHGTHVASIAAGNGRVSGARYIGIAPNASILNLRVLNSEGVGTTSGVITALDWVLTNRNLYNIRVVNISLGMAAVDSYRNDPVCLAVRQLVDAGIVVVAAAGNNGTDSDGNKVYGHIHSPGNEPSAITIGASNTFGTDSRTDDGITTYSSRGPTRSFWTDESGDKHYDNLIKPDLVAPGNKIIDAEAVDNSLVTQHPELDAGVSN
ncbi:MAG: S8 family serine peptidase, partial [Acidobacteria bacterium]|nr:S8 family serine peptidase [Acidobacteriota bacterium]